MVLLEASTAVDVSVIDQDGYPELHCASSKSNIEMTQVLLYHININAPNKEKYKNFPCIMLNFKVIYLFLKRFFH